VLLRRCVTASSLNASAEAETGVQQAAVKVTLLAARSQARLGARRSGALMQARLQAAAFPTRTSTQVHSTRTPALPAPQVAVSLMKYVGAWHRRHSMPRRPCRRPLQQTPRSTQHSVKSPGLPDEPAGQRTLIATDLDLEEML
jgi:hypothetical protein